MYNPKTNYRGPSFLPQNSNNIPIYTLPGARQSLSGPAASTYTPGSPLLQIQAPSPNNVPQQNKQQTQAQQQLQLQVGSNSTKPFPGSKADPQQEQQLPPATQNAFFNNGDPVMLPRNNVQPPPPDFSSNDATRQIKGAFIRVDRAYNDNDERVVQQPLQDTAGSSFMRDFITLLVWTFVIFTFPFLFCFYFNYVYEYERAIIFRMGSINTKDRSAKAGSTGLFFALPCIEEYKKVDMRTNCINFPPQNVLTTDNIPVQVDGVVYYRIHNAVLSLTQIVNPHISTNLLAQSILRSIVSSRRLSDLLSQRDIIADELYSALHAGTASWGIRVERVYIKEFQVSSDVQKSITAEAEAVRGARARTIAADGEKAAARSLKDAADILSLSPAGLQLRYIQTLSSATGAGGGDQQSKVILPYPMDFLSNVPGHAYGTNVNSRAYPGGAVLKS